MAYELKDGEIFVVDAVGWDIWKVFKIKYTKETPKCYLLRGRSVYSRNYKKNKCFKIFEDACALAQEHNQERLDYYERAVSSIKKEMDLQSHDYDPPVIKWERFEIMDFDSQ
jgi:hypothetical protein